MLTEPAARPVTPVPVPSTPLIGREASLAELVALLAEGRVRLVTLVGPAGAGKSRLALEVALGLCERPGWTVAYRDVRNVTDPMVVAASSAAALGIDVAPGRTPAAAIGAAVGKAPTLLLLDGAEGIRDAGPSLLQLLDAAPGLRLLVTTRRPLHVPRERRVAVDPLQMPAAGVTDPARLAEAPAVRLFLERARAVRADLALTPETADLIARICRRLDGLPLTIELAAGALRTLSPRQLLDRLEGHGADAGAPGVGLRDEAMDLRQTMDRSVALLEPEVRRLYARIGVFAGPFDDDLLEALLRAAEMRGIAAPRARVPDAIAELVDASLMRRTTAEDGTVRYAMAGIVRADALARLAEAREALVIHWAHAYALLELAEAAAIRLADRADLEALDRLEALGDDFQAAFEWARSQGDGVFQLRLAVALADFWGLRGHLAEGRMRLMAGLQRAGADASVLRARALDAAGALAYRQGDYAQAEDLTMRALGIAMELDERGVALKASYHLGVIAMMRGELDAAATRFEESLVLGRELGSDADLGVSLNALGSVLQMQGDLEAARSRFSESLAIKDVRGDTAGRGLTLANIGLLQRDLGELEAAAATLDESAAILERVGDRQRRSTALHNRGLVALDAGDIPLARERMEEALDIARDLGDRRSMCYALADLALVRLASGEPAAARLDADEALAAALRAHMPTLVAIALEAEATIDAAEGRHLDGARLWAAASAIRELTGEKPNVADVRRLERAIGAAREATPAADWALAWSEGACLTPEEAAELASRRGASIAHGSGAKVTSGPGA